jgi:membrane-associated phospholipid phosphatase
MHSLCLNFYCAHYFASRDIIPQQWAFPVYVAAALWVAWIGFSRVYMGMHTPIDIGGGAVIAIMVLSSYLAIDGESTTLPAPHRPRKKSKRLTLV